MYDSSIVTSPFLTAHEIPEYLEFKIIPFIGFCQLELPSTKRSYLSNIFYVQCKNVYIYVHMCILSEEKKKPWGLTPSRRVPREMYMRWLGVSGRILRE